LRVREEGITLEFSVSETFFSVGVRDMDRAVLFYSSALGAATRWSSPRWSSLEVAGVRIGLFSSSEHIGCRVGLHFAVSDLAAACASVISKGGREVASASEVAPGVLVAEVADTEDNVFSLQQASSS
jgi:predicted enzyme related to lactoylglutathione lyase